MLRFRRRRAEPAAVELNVIPLIDVVFFLLVFYVISTSFEVEAAVKVDRPASSRAAPVSGTVVPVAITKTGAIQVGSVIVDRGQVTAAVSAALKAAATDRVLVIPDRDATTGLLLAVMDACTAAGAIKVEVAARRQDKP